MHTHTHILKLTCIIDEQNDEFSYLLLDLLIL